MPARKPSMKLANHILLRYPFLALVIADMAGWNLRAFKAVRSILASAGAPKISSIRNQVNANKSGPV